MSIGGEFGFALVIIALEALVFDARPRQVAMSAVLPSLFFGAVLITFDARLARSTRAARWSRNCPRRHARRC